MTQDDIQAKTKRIKLSYVWDEKQRKEKHLNFKITSFHNRGK